MFAVYKSIEKLLEKNFPLLSPSILLRVLFEKTKTPVVTMANKKNGKYFEEPRRTQSKNKSAASRRCNLGLLSILN